MSVESRANTVQPVLDGITVIDFSANAAGPACSMLLADFGAKVIKIEPPSGDATRQWGKSRFGQQGQFTGTFLSMNRNKASVVLDMKSAEGRDTARALIKTADVVLQSFLPGVAVRLGLDYEQVSKINPEVIHCSISGFGLNGPLRERPGFDMLLQAHAGHMAITGEPGQPSVRIGPSSIDLLTGAHAAFGILLAIRHKEQSGHGQAIDVSLYDSAVYMVGNHIADYTGSGKAPDKFGSQFANMAPYGIYQAKDREFYLGVSSDDMWQRFCKAIARPDLGTDERFRSNSERLRHREPLLAVLRPLFREKTAQEWVDLAVELSIPGSLVHSIPEVTEQEQIAAREMLVDSGVDGVRVPGIPLKLSKTPGQTRRPAPKLGEDTEDIFKATHSSATN